MPEESTTTRMYLPLVAMGVFNNWQHIVGESEASRVLWR